MTDRPERPETLTELYERECREMDEQRRAHHLKLSLADLRIAVRRSATHRGIWHYKVEAFIGGEWAEARIDAFRSIGEGIAYSRFGARRAARKYLKRIQAGPVNERPWEYGDNDKGTADER